MTHTLYTGSVVAEVPGRSRVVACPRAQCAAQTIQFEDLQYGPLVGTRLNVRSCLYIET